MFEMLRDKFSGDDGKDRLYGLGLLASQLGSGQAPNAGPALQMLKERQSRNALKQQMQGGDFMGKFSEQEQAFLATLPPEAAQQLIAQRIFAAPAAPRPPIEINGQLVDPETYQVVGDFRTPDAPDAPEPVRGVEINGKLVNPITGEEIADYSGGGSVSYIASGDAAQSLGLDPTKSYNVATGPDGVKATEIGGSGTSVVVNNGGQSAFDEKTGSLLAQEAADISAAGASASRSLVQVDALESALSGASGGAATAFTAAAANMGIKLDGASEIEAAQAIISQMVPAQRPPGSGPMSDADLELFKQSLPRLINTPEGNQQIIRTMRRIAEYDIKRGEIARELQLGNINQQQAFDKYANLTNPLAGGGTSTQLTPAEQKWLEGN